MWPFKKKEEPVGRIRSVFLGRFQPFHKGHLEALKQALRESDEVILLIGSAQFHDTKENPFSASERKKMITDTIQDLEERSRVKIYQVNDLMDDDKYVAYVNRVIPKSTVFYYGKGHTKKLFKKAGYKIINLPRYHGISASEIRKRMIKDKNWEELLPFPVAEIIKKINGVERIKSFY